VTSAPSRAIAPADASAVPSVRGLRSWGAVLVAVVLTLAGVIINVNSDLPDGQSTGWPLRILFVGGVVLAALLVRRGSIFTAMVQPPLVLAGCLVLGDYLGPHSDGLLSSGVDLVRSFPLMVVGTAAAIVVGVIRLVAQPLRRRTSSDRPQSSAHA